jgi:uncharacterized protein YcfJ
MQHVNKEIAMKKIVLPAMLVVAAGLCAAQEMGRVISSTPMIQQVGVPRQVCNTQPVVTSTPKSGAGAVMGAIAGGAMGNAVGDGGGRALATMIGLVGGAILGDKVEGGGQQQVQNVQSCATQTFYENRTVSYNVVYEYAAKQYSVQMPNDPGPFVKLQITPVSAAPPQAPAATTYVQPVATVQEVYTQPAYVAVQPGYYARPYYPPVGINLDFGYSSGGRHGQWR